MLQKPKDMLRFVLESGMGYKDISEELGVAYTTVFHIANGTRKPRYPLVDKIATLYSQRKSFLKDKGVLVGEENQGGDHDSL